MQFVLNGDSKQTSADASIQDVVNTMEVGCNGVSMNTAIAAAKDPILMALAMKKGIEAGREAFLAGHMPNKRFASASLPIEGIIF
jgi:thiazole synthase